jgi:HupE / UreJ protein
MLVLRLILVWLTWACATSAAQAHLIVSQRGTLNIVGDSAFMVLSLPVSAFKGIDDDADGLLSLTELRANASKIEAQIKKSVILENSQGRKTLDGLMLNTVPPENDHTAAAKQIAVLGRYSLEPDASNLMLTMPLFGVESGEQTEHVTVTKGARSQLMTLSPDQPRGEVMPTNWQILMQQAWLGAKHILAGADHLIFLLLVLLAGLSLRHTVWVLTCFTLGHAITLIACSWFDVSVAASIAEPAIAMTIIGMVWFDRWANGKTARSSTVIRMAFVFVCALIHGLGLASALKDLGLDPVSKAYSLLGFNIGIELAQLCMALLVTAGLRGMQFLIGCADLIQSKRILSLGALFLGIFWLFERIFLVL